MDVQEITLLHLATALLYFLRTANLVNIICTSSALRVLREAFGFESFYTIFKKGTG